MERPHFPAQLWALAGAAPVTVRLGGGTVSPAMELPARISEVQPDAVVVVMATGATPALLASGSREVELVWASPAGRHEQRCRVRAGSAARSGPRRWLLTPLGAPILLQRRRYVRVPARIDVTVEIDGRRVAGTTMEVSEGGFRIRIPPIEVIARCPASVHVVTAGRAFRLAGHVVRARQIGSTGEPGVEAGTEVVVAFTAIGEAADAVRRLVLARQLRNRAARGR